MKFDKKLWQGKVMTVNGLVDADEMGITLPHEHLFMEYYRNDAIDLKDGDLAAAELKKYHDAGGKTIVDATNMGIARNPLGLKKISEQTGVNIVMGSGYYMEAWMPDDVKYKTIDDIVEQIIKDIVEGVDGTGIRAGFIGEVGISNTITPNEIKSLKATARAQKETGVAINLHFNIEAREAQRFFALGILKSEGVDMDRVIISHFIPRTSEIEYYEQVAEVGCNIEFDLFGYEITADISRMLTDIEEQVRVIKILDKLGLLEKVFISQDICRQEQLTVNGGYGYAHILKNVVPQFLARGITDNQIKTILVNNPKRVFPIKF